MNELITRLFVGQPRLHRVCQLLAYIGLMKHYVADVAHIKPRVGTAVQLVFNPFSQFVPQLELYSQLQLSLWSDPIAFSVPKST